MAVTAFPVPTPALENAKAGVPPKVTSSSEITPTREAAPVTVAAVVPSYTLSPPVRPLTVNTFAVMFAINVGWVSVYFHACVPERVNPETTTDLPMPTVAEAKFAVAFPMTRLTESPAPTPTKDAPAASTVVDVVRSYSLLAADIPVTERGVRSTAPKLT